MTYAAVVVFALLVAVPVVVWLESDHPYDPPPPRKRPRK